MSEKSWRLNRLLVALPGVLTVLLVFVGSVPIGVPFVGPMLPALGLIAVYVFAIQRPELMPHWLAFLVGLLQDLLSGGPLGLNALVLLAVQGFCSAQRRVLVGRTFVLNWAAFVLVALAAALASWLIACIYFFALVAPADALLQVAITVTLFPFVAALLLAVSDRVVGKAYA